MSGPALISLVPNRMTMPIRKSVATRERHQALLELPSLETPKRKKRARLELLKSSSSRAFALSLAICSYGLEQLKGLCIAAGRLFLAGLELLDPLLHVCEIACH